MFILNQYFCLSLRGSVLAGANTAVIQSMHLNSRITVRILQNTAVLNDR